MNDKDQKNGASRGRLIFTVPAYGFVIAVHVDWLAPSNYAGFSAETFVDAPRSLGFHPLGSMMLSERPQLLGRLFRKRWRTIAGLASLGGKGLKRSLG